MTSELTFKPNWTADPSHKLRETYGDIYCLDAFPWVDDVDDRYDAVLEQRDVFDCPDGHVRRSWRVTGSSGLGRSSERGFYLALLLLTAESGWDNSKIKFTARALARHLKMEPGVQAYEWIAAALDRLVHLQVRFQGMTEHSRTGTRCITVYFCLVSSIEKTVQNDEAEYIYTWNSDVLRALRSAVEASHEKTPALSMEQLLSRFLTPKNPEQTRPGQVIQGT